MANIQRNFVAGRMNKSLDERLIPNGEYIDALNVRLGSTEESEIGAVENAKGNVQVTSLQYIDGTALSSSARCIGAFQDGANETVYWFVHDPAFTVGATGKLDLIVSYNVITGGLIYHVVSVNDGSGANTTLNFDANFLITSVNKIDNLIFFTDNLNAPRVINIDFNYPDPFNNIDQFTNEQILVIKKPPLAAPTLNLLNTTIQDSFLEDNFICFAYRYKYSNGEYSAVSQFSEPAFDPRTFSFSSNSFLNEGMVNSKTGAQITYNTGSSLVVGIDLLFKEANDPTIKIIEKIDKSPLGPHNTTATYVFTNSKIFTVLPEYEILRLYDNVPRQAKAQTLMGNRLVYGNYTEGYNLIDINSSALTLNYSISLQSTSLGGYELTTSNQYAFPYNAFGNLITLNSSGFTVDFTNNLDKLKKGYIIEFDFNYNFNQFNGTNLPNEQQGDTIISFNYTLTQDYSSVSDLYNSSDFKSKIGLTADSIQTVSNAQNGLGSTMTDNVNFSLLGTLGTGTYQYAINQTGITSNTLNPPDKGEPIGSFVSGNTIGFLFPCAQYIETTPGTTNLIISYFDITSVSVTIQESANLESLHSNRGYELGIVYMDEYNRATTALVSSNNTINIPCSRSANKNEIIATIPVSQRAPAWATRYKFVLKPDRGDYETIYSSIFFEDPNSINSYLLLEGDNIAKVEEGDRLIVKRDVNGISQSCIYATVLEKTTESAGFITPTSGNLVPGGTYMKMSTADFSATESSLDVINFGLVRAAAVKRDRYPVAYYKFYTTETDSATPPVTTNTTYNVPIGTRIVMKIEQVRRGIGSLCEERTSVLEKTFISDNTYIDMYAWFVGENIANVIENEAITFSGTPADPVGNIVISGLYTGAGDALTTGAAVSNGTEAHLLTVFGGKSNSPTTGGDLLLNNYYRFYQNIVDNTYSLLVSGTRACRNNNPVGASTASINFTVYRRDAVIIFETEPKAFPFVQQP